jgi:uncharacterized coiled-coil DUF342 family protein
MLLHSGCIPRNPRDIIRVILNARIIPITIILPSTVSIKVDLAYNFNNFLRESLSIIHFINTCYYYKTFEKVYSGQLIRKVYNYTRLNRSVMVEIQEGSMSHEMRQNKVQEYKRKREQCNKMSREFSIRSDELQEKSKEVKEKARQKEIKADSLLKEVREEKNAARFNSEGIDEMNHMIRDKKEAEIGEIGVLVHSISERIERLREEANELYEKADTLRKKSSEFHRKHLEFQRKGDEYHRAVIELSQ